MKFFTTAYVTWLDDGCCDVKYLDIWAKTACTYRPGQPVGESWFVDEYTVTLGLDTGGNLFSRAADALMRYQFYPPDVMQHTSDFGLWERWVQIGDRILQRVHVWQLWGKPLLDVLGLTEIADVVNEPRRVGFTYVTVAPHTAEGEWSAYLEWKEDDRVTLRIKSISRPRRGEPARNHAWMRKLQQRAHRRGLAYFQQLVLDKVG